MVRAKLKILLGNHSAEGECVIKGKTNMKFLDVANRS